MYFSHNNTARIYRKPIFVYFITIGQVNKLTIGLHMSAKMHNKKAILCIPLSSIKKYQEQAQVYTSIEVHYPSGTLNSTLLIHLMTEVCKFLQCIKSVKKCTIQWCEKG